MATTLTDRVIAAMRLAYSRFGEREWRIYAATESLMIGHGGVARVAEVLGSYRSTIKRGIAEPRA